MLRCSMALYADTNFTMSSGVSASPQEPPIVPLMPEMDFISVIAVKFLNYFNIISLQPSLPSVRELDAVPLPKTVHYRDFRPFVQDEEGLVGGAG